MPELPEVETVRRTLEPKLAGLKFTAVQILMPKVIKTPDLDQFKEIILDKKIIKINRRGKYLLLHLSEKYTLLVHLRMTGRLTYSEKETPVAKHTHVIFTLSNGCQLRFCDTRQFGRLWMVPVPSLEELAGFKDLGVEPLDDRFTRDYLKKELRRRHARIKPLLLDQTFIAGLGNIYTDEALHRARINPERLCTTLTPREIAHLYHAIREVLQEGIENRGTTVRDFIDGNGRAGGYQELLRVYSREGEPCPHCNRPIVRKKLGGRSSYYCPFCQKI
ncbi:Formamidopyrimidine-DNA glycosylase [Pelotomaculum sp. FP]|uniref:DNA-formamidopyrimidine glycosylase n=1 Tax=Pelotomaculum sp. FP TaxID=261474 RepID=UPI00106579DB|nr:DNA-formamidopyrimidine glycosylase [Pelotomaculum sp. FP]TEB13573.1 Formamidopyrimidine-DNA glycosylase [Pelotomaculum sp. FP]